MGKVGIVRIRSHPEEVGCNAGHFNQRPKAITLTTKAP